MAQIILVSTGHAERASVRALLSATGSPAPALPLAVVHDPWWTTACCLDDLADSPDGQETADPEVDQTLLAVVAAGTPLPLPIVQKLRVPEPVRAALAAEVVRCWVDAAEGQLRDIGGEAVTATRSSVRKTCLGKSGAPFAVITAMAARLAGAASSAWRSRRAFGEVFGLVWQLFNDQEDILSGGFEDLRNGTVTYLLACCLEQATPDSAQRLTDVHSAAGNSAPARSALTRELLAPAVLAAYAQDCKELQHRAHRILDEPGGTEEYLTVLRDLVDQASCVLLRTDAAV
ncbi:polyprenyl synthetase family protein [Streptomyces lasalocidi]